MTDEQIGVERGDPRTAAEVAAQMDLDDQSVRAELRRRFQLTPLHRVLGLEVVETSPERCVVTMPVEEGAFNSTGNVHGGAYATLIDVAAGTAAAVGSSFRPGVETLVTADLHVRYLGRPKTDLVRAVARVIKAGRQLIVVECQVLDGLDRIVVSADFTSMIVPLRDPLKPLPTARQTDPDL